MLNYTRHLASDVTITDVTIRLGSLYCTRVKPRCQFVEFHAYIYFINGMKVKRHRAIYMFIGS